MAAGDMADFVGEHADDLSRMFGRHDEAGGDEQSLAAGDEGVQGLRANQMDMDRAGVELRRPEQWRRIAADGMFDFGVVNLDLALRRRRIEMRRADDCRRPQTAEDADASGQLHESARLVPG